MNRFVLSNKEGRIFVTDDLIKSFVMKETKSLKVLDVVVNTIPGATYDIDIFVDTSKIDNKDVGYEVIDFQNEVKNLLDFHIGINPLTVNVITNIDK